jgi:hypothetical protein
MFEFASRYKGASQTPVHGCARAGGASRGLGYIKSVLSDDKLKKRDWSL